VLNEELTTANEELQATHEELRANYEQLQQRNQELVQARLALEQLNQQLEQRVTERTGQLQAAQTKPKGSGANCSGFSCKLPPALPS
jgi:predicted  nucleic acid-binding Zn-ribbon protein